MCTAGKVILGIIAAIVLVIILAVVGVVVWWQKGGGKEMAKAAVESVEKSEKEGREFGRTADNEQCVAEALQRGKKDSSLGGVSTQVFTQGCLKASKETPGFCTGVPRPTQIIDSTKWLGEQCRKRGFGNDQYCLHVMQKVEEHCSRKN